VANGRTAPLQVDPGIGTVARPSNSWDNQRRILESNSTWSVAK